MNALNDIIIHVKSKEDTGNVEKKDFPITRWENILGAPHITTKETLPTKHVGEYVLYLTGDEYLSDAEYEACFGDLTTP